MVSVTQKIKMVKQPYGGFVKLSDFKETKLTDKNILKEENINSSLVGLTVDYMTRYALGADLSEAFKISLIGAKIINDTKKAASLLSEIDGINDKSIYYACKLVGYDVCVRYGAIGYKNVLGINANGNTISNIKIMINRSVLFFRSHGPIIKSGLTLDGGYTETINSGDIDFVTKNTLWDLKVSSKKPNSSHTLQLLIYYIMGKNSIHQELKCIDKIGFFNPRLNVFYEKEVNSINCDVLTLVTKDIIGYDNKNSEVKTKVNKQLLMNDIMKILHCSRYLIIKFFAENNLPLKKDKNKYYINENELYLWIEERKKERRERLLIFLIVSITLIFMLFFFLLFILKQM